MGPGWSCDPCLRHIYPQRRSTRRLELSQAPWFVQMTKLITTANPISNPNPNLTGSIVFYGDPVPVHL